MLYSVINLCGNWEMDYLSDEYHETENVWKGGTLVESSVPGYWEDMVSKFQKTPFFRHLEVNPEYGLQQYPIYDTAPDMALPNIVGNFLYQRKFMYRESDNKTYIFFEGVQNSVSIWINGIFIGHHEGYSAPFELSIPSGTLISGENTITLSVSNLDIYGYSNELISGLSSRATNQYSGGISGNIEIRAYFSEVHDVYVKISEDCDNAHVVFDSKITEEFDWAVYDNENILLSGTANSDFTFSTAGLQLWTPEEPKLYKVKIMFNEFECERSFGVRKLNSTKSKLLLNNIVYYLRGVCEHCYYPETVHPVHDLTYYKSTIKKIKSLGFNFIRFHTYVPFEEYLQAADELGMLVQIECPNNTTLLQWKEIVQFCKKHTSVVIYCCGNELLIDESYIDYLEKLSQVVHDETDALFSPQSALRGVEYHWIEPEQQKKTSDMPFKHHPMRIKMLNQFSDVYNSYTLGYNSYFSYDSDPEKVDSFSDVYNKPRLSHEICIDGTYIDLGMEWRYEKQRIGKTALFSSVRKHLEEKGLIKNAAVYYRNSCEWQRIIRKYCFENARLSKTLCGYDFLGPIDTHWHTFGYHVGMMNEFYELKHGETVRNVLMYNSADVILSNIGKKRNFFAGEALKAVFSVSHYGKGDITKGKLRIYVFCGERIVYNINLENLEAANGELTHLYNLSYNLPKTETPQKLKLYAVFESRDVFCENEWELYLFPKANACQCSKARIMYKFSKEELMDLLKKGESVVLLSADGLKTLPTTYKIALAGRTSGNLATVIYDHPIVNDIPNDGFCGWQFAPLIENGSAVCFDDGIPFDPIIEIVSSYKNIVRQSALFEYKALNGKLLVCTLNLKENDSCACYLKYKLLKYAGGEAFAPKQTLSEKQLLAIFGESGSEHTKKNDNEAFNSNDKTAVRKH